MAVERNARLASRLRRRFERADVVVVEKELLEVPLPGRPYRVVASIPFAITTAVLGRILDRPDSALERAALVVEWGAGKRFSDPRPTDPRILWWGARFRLRVRRRLDARSFSPPPAVDAAVLLVERRRPPLVRPRDQAPFLGLLAHALEGPRAPAAHALAPIFSKRQLGRLLRDLEVDPQASIGLLSIEQWAAINAAMVALVDPGRWPLRKPRWSKALVVNQPGRQSKRPARGLRGST